MSWKWIINKYFSSLKMHINSLITHKKARIIKRFVWVVVVLGATIGCVITISDRIKYLNSHPTATTISIIRQHILTFPAVTVCNLNSLRFEELEEKNLTDVIGQRSDFVDVNVSKACKEKLELVSQSENLSNITYEELAVQAKQHMEDFIRLCYFDGKRCDKNVFQPIFTDLGICYTFNSGTIKPPLQSKGTGQHQGLELYVFVNQSDYAIPSDAGVKISIHAQSEPPLPDDQGIGVPTGRNAFISIKQQKTNDQTRRNCTSDVLSFNFLQGEYSTYSASACLVDCIHTSMADDCECIGARSFYSPDTPRYSQLPNCTLEEVCCVMNELMSPHECNCPAACSSILYETTVSYSYFPAEHASEEYASRIKVPANFFPTNFLKVNVYFETLNFETQTTTSVYSFVSLLSDIGGQLGLFLGLSVISLLDFWDWIIKMIRGHDLSAEIKNQCPSCCQKHDKVTVEFEISTAN